MGNRFDKANIYTEDERMIGSWMGKPLYQKTFDIGSNIAISQSTWTSTGVNFSTMNLDKVVRVFAGSTDSSVLAHGVTTDIKCYPDPSDNLLKLQTTASYSDETRYFTIQYTKTNDATVNVGTENDYSLDEQIIGTWIDGKLLYQKTIIKTNFAINNNASFAHDIQNVESIFIKEGFLNDNGNIILLPMIWTDTFTGVYVNTTQISFKGTGVWGASAGRTLCITVLYTKTTD